MPTISDDEAFKLVVDMPIFGGLDDSARSHLRNGLRVEHLSAGTCFLIEEDRVADELFVVLRGEVAITVEDKLLDLCGERELIGLLSVTDGAPRTASATAFSDIVLAILSRREFTDLMALSPRFARNVIDRLTRDVRELHRDDEAVRLHFDDQFDSPNARLVAGPHVMEDADLRVFIVHGPPTAQARLLPPGVRPLPGLEDRWVLISAHYPKAYTLSSKRRGQPVVYSDTAPYLPCLLPDGTPALFCVESYSDNYMAIFLGRELYGIPRRFGLSSLKDAHIDLNVDNSVVLRAGWESSVPLTDPAPAVSAAFDRSDAPPPTITALIRALIDVQTTAHPTGEGPVLPVLVRNQVPDIQHSDGERQRIDELIELSVRVRHVEALKRLERPYLRRFVHPWMLGGRCVGGFRLRATLTISHAKRVRDYLAMANVNTVRATR